MVLDCLRIWHCGCEIWKGIGAGLRIITKGDEVKVRIICAIGICLVAVSALCEPAPKYEVATITDVKPHQASDDRSSGAATYEVSVKVESTLYVVLYTDTFGTKTVRYAAGRELMVQVGKDKLTYNDILGQSHDVPIMSRTPVTTARQSK
jgi:hypothetical protein